MPVDLYGTDQQQDPTQDALGQDFYRGKNFLGRDTAISLTGQEPGQSASPSAGGAPVGPTGQSGGPLTSVTGGGMTDASSAGGLPPALGLALKAAGVGENALKFFQQFGLPESAGAMQTPSGQWTVTAPEALRNLQFPDAAAGGGEIPGPSIPSGEAGPGFDVGGAVGPAIGGASSIFGLINAARSGNPAGTVGPAINLATLVGTETGLLPEALTSLTGAGIPFAAALSVLTSILGDELADPGGRKSAVQNFNQMMAQQVPGEARNLQFAAALEPLINDSLSTEQAMQLFQVARAGLKSEELLADPISRQGKEKAGVKYGDFPGVQETMQALGPKAWLSVVRLQDLLAKRGVTPDQLETGASPYASDLYGYVPPEGFPWMTPEQIQFGQVTMPSGGPAGSVSPEGPSLWLSPTQLLGKSGTDIPRTSPYGYAYDPQITAALDALQPGGYEAGLRGILSEQPGYASSPFASLWGASPASEPGTIQSEVAQTVSPLDLPAPGSSGGERFQFETA